MMRFDRFLLLLASVFVLVALLCGVLWWSSAAAAVVLPVGLPEVTPAPGGCARATAAAYALAHDAEIREDMVAVLHELETATPSRASAPPDQQRQQYALQHAQRLINFELQIIAEQQAVIRAFQKQQHCERAK